MSGMTFKKTKNNDPFYINDREPMEIWLDSKPVEWCVALLLRRSLRILPTNISAVKFKATTNDVNFVNFLKIQPFRNNAIAFYNARLPKNKMTTKEAAIAAAKAYSAFDSIGASDGAHNYAGVSCSNIALLAAYPSFSGIATRAASAYAPHHFPNSSTAQIAAAFPIAASASAAAFRNDCRVLEKGMTPEELAATPIWYNGEPPDYAELWKDYKTYLHSLNDNWEVWTEWYEARRDGLPYNDALEIKRLLIDEKLWLDGASTVNAELKSIEKNFI